MRETWGFFVGGGGGGGEEMRFHIHDIYPENLTDYIKLRQHKLSYCPKGIAFKQYKIFSLF